MACTLLDHELGVDSDTLELVDDQLRLLDWHQQIGIAVDNEGRRIVGGDMVHGADLAADLENPGLVGNRSEALGGGILLVEVERRLESLEDAPSERVLPRFAIVVEVRRREEAGDSLDTAR